MIIGFYRARFIKLNVTVGYCNITNIIWTVFICKNPYYFFTSDIQHLFYQYVKQFKISNKMTVAWCILPVWSFICIVYEYLNIPNV